MTSTNWRPLFAQALDQAQGNRTVVAQALGVSRTTVSLVASGKYHAGLARFGARVLEVYALVACPHTEASMSLAQCRTWAHSPAPTSSARAARHWRACQACPQRPPQRLDHDVA